jgi:hypothetical protein
MSTYTIAEELTKEGHPVSPRKVAGMLKADDYRLRSNRKTKEGKEHPDRNEQFEYINRQSLKFMRKGEPVVADSRPLEDGLGIPEVIALREERKAALKEALAAMEGKTRLRGCSEGCVTKLVKGGNRRNLSK